MRTLESFDASGSVAPIGAKISLSLLEGLAEVYAMPGRTVRVAGSEAVNWREAVERVNRLRASTRIGLAMQVQEVLGPAYAVTGDEWSPVDFDRVNGNHSTLLEIGGIVS